MYFISYLGACKLYKFRDFDKVRDTFENGLRTADMLPIIYADALEFFIIWKPNAYPIENQKLHIGLCFYATVTSESMFAVK